MPAVLRHRLILLVIVLIAIAVRFTYIAMLDTHLVSDGVEGEMAHNIVAHGRWFYRADTSDDIGSTGLRGKATIDTASTGNHQGRPGQLIPEVDEPVGTSLIIAGVWALTGSERYTAVAALQGIVDSLTVLLIYWVAMQLFKRRRPALIAAALYAINLPEARETATVYNDLWAIQFTVWILALYLVAMRSPHRWRWWIICGLCAGVGTYFRPQVLLLAPVLACATAFATGWREALRRGAVTTLVGCLLLVPWTIRNYNDFHAFVPTRTSLWLTAWGGFGEMANDFGGHFGLEPLVDLIHRSRPALIVETPAWDTYAKRYVVDVIEQHPLWYLELLAHRVAVATVWQYDTRWMYIEAGKWSHSKGTLPDYIASHPLNTLEDAVAPCTFLLAMLGLALTWRRRRREHAILIAFALAVLIPYLTVYVQARYLLPAMPAYMIWIALGADRAIERAGGRLHRARSMSAAGGQRHGFGISVP
jgi:4-amino-4-deoxy-L-arabinose transferase-like glycosyltransferase